MNKSLIVAIIYAAKIIASAIQDADPVTTIGTIAANKRRDYPQEAKDVAEEILLENEA